jgi:hypothetical protein
MNALIKISIRSKLEGKSLSTTLSQKGETGKGPSSAKERGSRI